MGVEWRRVVVYRFRIALEVRGVAASLNLWQKRGFDLQQSFSRPTVQSINRNDHNAKEGKESEQRRGKREEGRGKGQEGTAIGTTTAASDTGNPASYE